MRVGVAMTALGALLGAAMPITGCNVVSGLDDFAVGQRSASSAGGQASASSSATGSTSGTGGEGGTARVPSNCQAVMGGTGVHVIDPDGDRGNPPFDAYCQQDVDGGGWTLVGRSERGGSGDIGWRVDRGDVASGAYSLDVVSAGLVFGEVLLLATDGDEQAYKVSVPPSFVIDHADSALDVDATVTYLQGGCVPSDGSPQMLRYLGFTDFTTRFFIRDIAFPDGDYGMTSYSFALAYPECDLGGGLNGRQGALYVR